MDPFAEPDLIAGNNALASGMLTEARTHFEHAANSGNVVALGELCGLCDQLGDFEAVRAHAAKLEALALMSAEASYVAAKYLGEARLSIYDADAADEIRRKYLLNAAEIGNSVAQLEVASNFDLGHNGFPKSRDDARKWIQRATRVVSPDELPDWAREILDHDA